jgi:molecular chaperone HscA
VETAVTVKPSYGLDDEHIAHMLSDAINSAGLDMKIRMLREAQVAARQLLDATEAALAADGDALLAPPERQLINHHLYLLVDLIETAEEPSDENIAALNRTCDSLNQVTQEFASRRMNASVARALSGQRLETLSTHLES